MTQPSQTSETVAIEADAPRRRVGGRDPFKRRQILDGAKRVFMRDGFEAASVNDIAAEANVSKGTLYVYFDGKEDLFAALIDRERADILAATQGELDPSRPAEEALRRFGVALVEKTTAEGVVRAQRMVLGVVDTMPKLATRFFSPEGVSARTVLRGFFETKVAAGELAIPDYDLASAQFLELAQAGVFRSRLFNNLPAPPTRAEIERVVSAGAAMFVRFYGTGDGRIAPGSSSKEP